MESGALPTSITWISNLLTGTVGTSVAVVAVALCGYQMLNGRMPTQRMTQVVIGSVLIFGAGTIAQALAALASDGPVPAPIAQPQVVRITPAPSAAPLAPYDPYAGASVERPTGH